MVKPPHLVLLLVTTHEPLRLLPQSLAKKYETAVIFFLKGIRPTTGSVTATVCLLIEFSGSLLRWRLPKRLINYSWASTVEKACCKLLQGNSWDLETPEKAELGSDTLEQSLLQWLNVVKHETTQLLQCLNERFLVHFSCIKFCLLCAPSDRISSTIKLYEPMCRARV